MTRQIIQVGIIAIAFTVQAVVLGTFIVSNLSGSTSEDPVVSRAPELTSTKEPKTESVETAEPDASTTEAQPVSTNPDTTSHAPSNNAAPAAPLRYTEVGNIQTAIFQAGSVDGVTQAMIPFAETYNFDIDTESSSTYWATWDNISPAAIGEYQQYAAAFVDEWSKYPPEWVRLHGLKKVWFISNLVVGGDARAAMPQAPTEMVYDVTYGADNYAKSVIHHEYQHFVDYSRKSDYYFTDAVWSSFNDPSFSYGSGGASAYTDPDYSYGLHPEDGFVTNYARYGEEEDRAELYGFIFYTPDYYKLLDWLENDQRLLNKYNHMISMLQSEHSGFTADYFASIHKQ